MDNLIKILTLHNEIEAHVLSSILKEKNIPHIVKNYMDSAYNGIWQTQLGWGIIEAPSEYKDEIVSLYEEAVKNKNIKFQFDKENQSNSTEASIIGKNRILNSVKYIIIILFFMISLWLYLQYKNKNKLIKVFNNSKKIYFNWRKDKKALIGKWKENNKVAVINIDDNLNNHFEKIMNYNKKGIIISEYYDNNEDGLTEKLIRYYKNDKLIIWIDNDEDGMFDKMIYKINNQIIEKDINTLFDD